MTDSRLSLHILHISCLPHPHILQYLTAPCWLTLSPPPPHPHPSHAHHHTECTSGITHTPPPRQVLEYLQREGLSGDKIAQLRSVPFIPVVGGSSLFRPRGRCSHTSLSHTSLSHTSLSHTSLSHTSLSHTSLSQWSKGESNHSGWSDLALQGFSRPSVCVPVLALHHLRLWCI